MNRKIWQINDYSLRTKLIVAFIMVTVLSVSAVALLANRAQRQVLTDNANQRLSSAALQTAAELDDFIRANLDAIRAEAQLPPFVELLSPINERPSAIEQTAILASLTKKNPEQIISYALLDRNGVNVTDNLWGNVGRSEANEDYFKIPMAEQNPYVSPVLFLPRTGEPVIFFSSPVLNIVRKPIGVLRVMYRADILQELIEESTRLVGEDSFAVLFDENHLHLAHGDLQAAPEVNYKLVAMPQDSARLEELQAARRLPDWPVEELSTNLPALEQSLATAAEQPFFNALDVATGNRVNQAAAASLKTQPWQVVFFQPRDVFLAPIEEQVRGLVLLIALIAIGAALVGVVVAQLLASPITRLTAVAQQITSGNLTAQASVESQDETGQLALAFNTMTSQLRTIIDSLEDQVQQRTAELVLSMEVGQHAAAIRNIDELLPTITEFIREKFNLYYVHVYFVDDVGQNLVIKAGTGSVGEELLARRHSLPVGHTSIVGRVAADGHSVVVSDTATSDIHRPNPLLPNTRSEVAVPLVVEGRVLGVLDMQADQENTFTEANVTVFEAMATQLAIAIDSARQWALTQAAQQKSQEAIRQLTRQSWADRLAPARGSLGFAYDLASVMPVKDELNPNGLSAPVVVQNEPIGQLSVSLTAGRNWSEDEESLVAAVAQQLAQKAENLRLFEATQQKATRELITRQITDRIRASRDIKTALTVAAQELSKALGTARAVVDLKVAPADDAGNGASDHNA